MLDLFDQPLRPINLGLESFYESMTAQGVDADRRGLAAAARWLR